MSVKRPVPDLSFFAIPAHHQEQPHTSAPAASANAYSPQRTKTYHIVPATPGAKRRRASSDRIQFLFTGAIASESSPFQSFLRTHSIQSSQYENSGRTYTIVKQTGTKTCGASCSMMLALDVIAKRHVDQAPASAEGQPSAELFTEDFIRWFHGSGLTKGPDLIFQLKREGFSPVLLTISKNKSEYEISEIDYTERAEGETQSYKTVENPVAFLSRKLRETNNSIIVSISHRIIAGHWIILDQISQINKDEFAFIRDPFTGKAYKITTAELSQCINDGCSSFEAVYLRN